MTHTLDRSAFGPITLHPRYRRRRLVAALAVLIAAALTAGAAVYLLNDSRRNYLTTNGWPQTGQGAYRFDGEQPAASADQHPVPIASVAKVMTAYLVIASYPLRAGAGGPTIGVSAADAADTDDRRHQDQSIVAVRAGERLTERQALMALLLPSANNVAVMLARLVSGSVDAFVAQMNKMAHQLGMGDTTYTDPSGFDEGTVSTAKDQLKLAETVARNATLSAMMATPSYRLPVAGRVHNTDTLLGQDGFSGMKTGSDDAAGGCFMFRTKRLRNGQEADLIGVVLGQPGHNLIEAGLYAAKQLADSLAPAA